MSKKNTLKIVVDTTYLLPVFGIGVEGLSDEDLLLLRKLSLEGIVELHLVSVIWSELLGKVYREARKHGVDSKRIEVAIKSLYNPRFYKWIKPGYKAIMLAYRVRKLGHRDNIDNILYATATTRKMLFLSMDKELKEFLSKVRLPSNNIVSHKELFSFLGY